MKKEQVWTTAAAASLVVIVAAVSWGGARSALLSHKHQLAIGAYLDCVNKYSAAKRSGRFPEDVPMPSASEVCEKYKR